MEAEGKWLDDECPDEMDTLSQVEIGRLEYLAEHPELENPILAFLDKAGKQRRCESLIARYGNKNSALKSSSIGGNKMESDENRPVARVRTGRFQISLWKRKVVLPVRHAYDSERTLVVTRACVQHSRWNRISREWQNQSVWCSVEELRDLVQVLDGLNETALINVVPREAAGENQPR